MVISSHLISSRHFIITECAVIGHSRGELGCVLRNDPVRRECDQSQRTLFRRNEVGRGKVCMSDVHTPLRSSNEVKVKENEFATSLTDAGTDVQ